ncbi:GMC family oxidoreductase [Verminephrobacter aporrectodeae subsp. tuberculatae]|uniref:GMC family oxidoreductase n=1 Tax=Verminephrobacter aporrectodeae subsp. tuberculatae TaxID=1110392 RepID=A0ABT3KSB3_9BURK|nr:GMC family oxidoreductase [Verminephrobacter aporrectodeae]MCW5321219.1 GMC family oxidoreductase [Verminephrobacter aporrectodeae subsp. tuberculatae]MCW8199469.1 GMC family oxidoreductase [Verminephrobacter aporrectodeae subsp. tuberculatae]
MTTEYDDIIVGGGSVGCWLAHRLMSTDARRVLLIEAGPDVATRAALPTDQLQGNFARFSCDWGLTMEGGGLAPASYPLARILGGGSSINGAAALRALPADFADWSASCGEYWSWKAVAPHFAAIENDATGSGAIPISRCATEDRHPVAAAFVEGSRRLGFAVCADFNEGDIGGVGSMPMNLIDNRAWSAAELLYAARERPNFTLLTQTQAERVVFNGQAAVGVEVLGPDGLQRITGGRIVLAAGAIHSPAILMRSGVGHAPELLKAGVAPLFERRGIGRGLQDHPGVGFWSPPRPDQMPIRCAIQKQSLLRLSSRMLGVDDGDPFDLQIYLMLDIGIVGTEIERMLPGPRANLMTAVLLRPRGSGNVRLTGPSTAHKPRIQLDFLSHPSDRQRLRESTRLLWRLSQDKRLAAHMGPFAFWTESTLQDDRRLDDALRVVTRTAFHPTGTARMGPESDPDTVVDERGAVHGIAHLFVADLSIMPVSPRSTTNVTSMMLGHRLGSMLSQANPPERLDRTTFLI